MENTIKRWLRRLWISSSIALIALLCLAMVALAVPASVTNFSGIPTSSTSISLIWSMASASTSTVIRYATTTYPTAPTLGTSAYNGTGNFTTLSGLAAGTNYYFSAWGFDGALYSPTAVTLLVTTPSASSSNTTLPVVDAGGNVSAPIPASAYQPPTIGGWSVHPIDDIFEWFADPTYTHGGLGMPTNNAVMFIFGMMVSFVGLITYTKWHNFFAAYTLVFLLSFLCVMIHVMQGYVIGLEILVGMGVWAIEHNFQ